MLLKWKKEEINNKILNNDTQKTHIITYRFVMDKSQCFQDRLNNTGWDKLAFSHSLIFKDAILEKTHELLLSFVNGPSDEILDELGTQRVPAILRRSSLISATLFVFLEAEYAQKLLWSEPSCVSSRQTMSHVYWRRRRVQLEPHRIAFVRVWIVLFGWC